MPRKTYSLLLILLCAATLFGQDNTIEKYAAIQRYFDGENMEEVYHNSKELKAQMQKSDTLYPNVIWYYITAATKLEQESRMKEDFAASLKYALEALSVIRENKMSSDESFRAREYWMSKNVIVAYFGLNKLKEARVYKDFLYKAYAERKLPEGLDRYFNFDYFTMDHKNIWGYEWYPGIPENRFATSFIKIVYYVYSQNEDGSDKDQLYRLHVLMFHQDSKDARFDYILERQMDTDSTLVSGSYYSYVYKKDIDYIKLREDAKSIILNKTEPDTRRIQAKKQ
jgi:hypothetical protein